MEQDDRLTIICPNCKETSDGCLGRYTKKDKLIIDDKILKSHAVSFLDWAKQNFEISIGFDYTFWKGHRGETYTSNELYEKWNERNRFK